MFAVKRFIPMVNKVLIEKIQPEAIPKLGMLIPPREGMKNFGKVIDAGPGDYINGKFVPVNAKIGQTVLLPDKGGKPVKPGDGNEYVVYEDKELLGTFFDVRDLMGSYC